MKLIHRIDSLVCKTGSDDCPALESVCKKGSMPGSLAVTTSFYRPHLDGGYKEMITGLMNAGCFDLLIEHTVELVITQGEHYLSKMKTPTPFNEGNNK